MKHLAILLLLASVAFGQQRVRPIDLTPETLTLIADSAKAVVSDSLAVHDATLRGNMIDSAKVVVGDSLLIERAARNAAINDSIRQASWIDWSNLNAALQSRISISNMYDYQDANINSDLQMLTRYCFYADEKYWNQSDRTNHYPYDVTSPSYIYDRRVPARMLYLVDQLYQQTGRDLYKYWLVDRYSAMLDSVKIGTVEGYSVKTLNLHYLLASDDAYFAHFDVPFHIVGYHIYQMDNVLYSSYKTGFDNFANAMFKSATRTGLSAGWGYAYRWNIAISDPATNRINNTFPPMYLFAWMKANNVTTDYITADSLTMMIDSLYTYTQEFWEEGTCGSEVTGGWREGYGDAAVIEQNYTHTGFAISELIVNTLNDTAWQTGWNTKAQKVINFIFCDGSANYVDMTESWSPGMIFFYEDAQKWGYTFPNDTIAATWEAIGLKPPHYNGNGWPAHGLVRHPREMLNRLTVYTSYMIEFFNDATINPGFAEYAKTDGTNNWSTNQTSFYSADGFLIVNRSVIGTSKSSFSVGFRTADSTPLCPDPSLWDFNTSTNTYSYDYPTQANGLTYHVSKRFGAGYYKIVPSTSDSLELNLDTPGDATGDSVFIFFYNQAGEIDTVQNINVTIGDSIQVDPSKGVFTESVRVGGSAGSGDIYTGFATHGSSLYLIKFDEDTYRTRAIIDSAIVFTGYHEIPDFYVESSSGAGWLYTWRAAEDLLQHVKETWDNGIDYQGILEDKTQ